MLEFVFCNICQGLWTASSAFITEGNEGILKKRPTNEDQKQYGVRNDVVDVSHRVYSNIVCAVAVEAAVLSYELSLTEKDSC